MSNVKRVIYTELDENECSMEKASQYYYLYNLIGVSDKFTEEYSKYEQDQISLRNKVMGRIKHEKNIVPDMNSAIFAVSTMHNKPVIFAEY